MVNLEVLMNEGFKIKEAKYFYARMIEEHDNSEYFIYNLRAFLASTRSVMQYGREEASKKPDSKKWYDDCMSKSLLLRFFKIIRDNDIHTEPILPRGNNELSIELSVPISESFSAELKDKIGNIKKYSSSDEPEANKKRSNTQTKKRIRYTFSSWEGSEDIPTLCERYIKELENVVNDGISKGYITG